jgi:tetratricopeptide (TPR) repeat protein
LLRLYAREQLAAEETARTRRAALERTLQAYFAKAQESVRHLRLRPPELPGQVLPAVPRDVVGTLADSYQWLAAEHMGLTVSLDQAWREGLGSLGQAVTRLLADFFEVYACWDEWERTHEVALRAARLAGDRQAEASLLCGLGDLRRFQSRAPEAEAYCRQSNVIFAGLEDTRGEIDSLIGLGRACRRRGELDAAAASFEETLALCRRLGDRDLEAKGMLFFAKVRRQQGRHAEALVLLSGCRDIFDSVGSAGYAAYSDLMIGILCGEAGDYDRAACHLRLALAFAQALGDPRWEAYVLLNLAVTAHACGTHDEARQHAERSLDMFQQAGDREGASRAIRLIAALREPAPSP